MFFILEIVSLVAPDNVSYQWTFCGKKKRAYLQSLGMESFAIILTIVLTMRLGARFWVESLLLLVHKKSHFGSNTKVSDTHKNYLFKH
jgi:hypothetical protein